MSKNINVNPGQYKVAGRERPGEDVPEAERERGKGRMQQDEAGHRRGERKQNDRKKP